MKPTSKVQKYLEAIQNGIVSNLPKPVTKVEQYLYKIALNGGNGSEHTHSNKAVLDEITAEKIVEWDAKLDADNSIGKLYPGSTHGEIFNDYENNKATGAYSTARGGGCTASGDNSIAIGASCSATHAASLAGGRNCRASGDWSFAFGESSKTMGSFAVAIGNSCNAFSRASAAFGDHTMAYGNNSVAFGSSCLTEGTGTNAFAEGQGTIASSNCQHVQGKYNIEDANNKYAFIIGNGTSNKRSNAIAIDWSGNIYVNNSETGVNVLELKDFLNVLEEKTTALETSNNNWGNFSPSVHNGHPLACKTYYICT